jgi:DNA-binding HxlR family transcriptional regulator
MEAINPDVYKSICPSRQVLKRIGDKWTVLIMGILERGTIRFGTLRREIEGISQKMLTQTLRNLERDGLIKREVFAEVPVRVEYSLTELGKSLLPVLKPLIKWSEEHLKEIEAVQSQFDQAQNNTTS